MRRYTPPMKLPSDFSLFHSIMYMLRARHTFNAGQIKRLRYMDMADKFDAAFDSVYQNFMAALTEQEYSEFMAEYTARMLS